MKQYMDEYFKFDVTVHLNKTNRVKCEALVWSHTDNNCGYTEDTLTLEEVKATGSTAKAMIADGGIKEFHDELELFLCHNEDFNMFDNDEKEVHIAYDGKDMTPFVKG